jgi:hypothetical protein
MNRWLVKITLALAVVVTAQITRASDYLDNVLNNAGIGNSGGNNGGDHNPDWGDSCDHHGHGDPEHCHEIPEIDGASLPKAILLLVSLYIVFRHHRRLNGK